MENMDINEYCRFCAEPKGADKLVNLQDDEEKCNEILLKLAFVNALYVKVNSDSILPRTICSVCNDSLNKAYEFFVEVKRAQEMLTNLFTASEEYLLIVSDGEGRVDDYLSSDAVEDIQNNEVHVQSISPDRELHRNINHVEKELTFHTKSKPKEIIVLKVSDGEGRVDDYLNSDAEEDIQSNEVHVQSISPDRELHRNINLVEKELTFHTKSKPKEIIVLKDEDFSKMKKKDIKTWKDYPWVCAICNIDFLDLDTLRCHSQTIHRKCSPFVCIYCKKDDIINFTPYVNHVRKHRQCLKNYCQYCNVYIKGMVLMKKHIKSHTDHQIPPCKRCGKVFKTADQQKNHEKLFTPPKPPRKCLTFTKEDVTCDLCNNEFTSIHTLKRHRREIHDPNRKKRYPCKFCEKAFYDNATLTAHLILHSKKTVECQICNKKFHAKPYLKSHMAVHTNVKPYSCAECGKRFRLRRQMEIHKLIHSGIKPSKCFICEKEYGCPKYLKKHVKQQHTGVRPYCCTFCSWKFMNWSECHKHMVKMHGTPLGKTKLTPGGRVSIDAFK